MNVDVLAVAISDLSTYSTFGVYNHIVLDICAPKNICNEEWLQRSSWHAIQKRTFISSTKHFRFAGKQIKTALHSMLGLWNQPSTWISFRTSSSCIRSSNHSNYSFDPTTNGTCISIQHQTSWIKQYPSNHSKYGTQLSHWRFDLILGWKSFSWTSILNLKKHGHHS